MFQRVLHIDGVPAGLPIGEAITITKTWEINTLFERYFFLAEHPNLLLDCRFLFPSMYNQLLKFLEEYKGGITLLAVDPVPEPVLSRFIEIHKQFSPPMDSFISVRLRATSPALKPKLETLFGVSE